MSPSTHAAIVADPVKALEEARHEAFEELHPDLLKRIDTALARAKQLDLDRAVYIKEGHFESYCYGPYIRIPLRSEAPDEARKEPV
jgi:hypothetical protein